MPQVSIPAAGGSGRMTRIVLTLSPRSSHRPGAPRHNSICNSLFPKFPNRDFGFTGINQRPAGRYFSLTGICNGRWCWLFGLRGVPGREFCRVLDVGIQQFPPPSWSPTGGSKSDFFVAQSLAINVCLSVLIIIRFIC